MLTPHPLNLCVLCFFLVACLSQRATYAVQCMFDPRWTWSRQVDGLNVILGLKSATVEQEKFWKRHEHMEKIKKSAYNFTAEISEMRDAKNPWTNKRMSIKDGKPIWWKGARPFSEMFRVTKVILSQTMRFVRSWENLTANSLQTPRLMHCDLESSVPLVTCPGRTLDMAKDEQFAEIRLTRYDSSVIVEFCRCSLSSSSLSILAIQIKQYLSRVIFNQIHGNLMLSMELRLLAQ